MTAEAIAQHSDHCVFFDERLREKNLGVFEGLTSEEAMKKYPEIFRLFKTEGAKYIIENGESTEQLLTRVLEFIEEIRVNHRNERVIIVTHGGVIRVFVKHTLGLLLDSSTRFKIMNTGLFRFVWEEKWMIAQMGELTHLNLIN